MQPFACRLTDFSSPLKLDQQPNAESTTLLEAGREGAKEETSGKYSL